MELSRVIRATLTLTVMGIALVGCSTGDPGDPRPATTTAGSTTKATSGPTSTSASGGSLASYDPCAELEAVASRFNLTAIEDKGDQECYARYSSSVAIQVGVISDSSLAEAGKGPNAEVSDTTVNGRTAKLVRKAASNTACAVAMGVGADRVDVAASATASLDEACDAATKVATAIEPKLPK